MNLFQKNIISIKNKEDLFLSYLVKIKCLNISLKKMGKTKFSFMA